MTLTAAGRLLLGLTAESTFLLDVNGSARVSGNTTISSFTFTAGAVMQCNESFFDIRTFGGLNILSFDSNLTLGKSLSTARVLNQFTFSYINDVAKLTAAANASFSNTFFDITSSGTGNGIPTPIRLYTGGGNILIAHNGTSTVGRVGIGTAAPNSSALLDITSETLGFLPPRMTTTQRDAITSPATGLQIYNTTTNANNFYNGSAWVVAGGGGIGIGDAITSATAGSVFFGGLGGILQQDNANFFWDDANNRLGIGTNTFWGTTKALVVGDTVDARLGVSTSTRVGVYLGFISGASQVFAYDYTSNASRLLSLNSFGGNVAIGTTTDAGFRLDVNGTARVSGELTTGNGVVGTFARFTGNAAFGVTRIAIGGSGGFGGGASYWLEVISNNLTLNASFSTGCIEFNGVNTPSQTYTGNNSALSKVNATISLTAGFTTYYNQYKSVLNATGNAFANTMYVRGYFVDSGTLTANSTTIIPIGFENVSGTNLFNSTSGSTLFGGQYASLVTSAKVQIDSSTQGFLPPRMTTSQKTSIASPVAGLQVYDTTLNQMSYYNGTTWVNF
jgi:hypothetical protein